MMNQRCTQASFAEETLVPERSHLLLMVAFSFLAGCLCVPWLTMGGWMWAVAAGSAALGILLRRLGRSAGCAAVLCFFALGALRTDAAMQVIQPQPGKYEITATVSGGATLRADNRVTFEVTSVLLDGEAVPGRAYCSLHYEEEPPALYDGAQLRFPGRVYLSGGPDGAPHMDFRLWMLQRGLSFGIVTYEEPECLNTPQTAPVTDGFYRIREACRRTLERTMGENARIAMALLLGQRDGLTEEENAAFQTLGIAHVMSVSGLHVGILGGIVAWLLKRLKLRRWVQLPVLGVFLLLYCAVTGFSAASNRAAIMLMTYTLARVVLRWPDRLTVLALAMLLVLCIQPLHASSAGFVLSFSAVLAITLYVDPMSHALERVIPDPTDRPHTLKDKRSVHRREKLRSAISTAAAAQLGVLLPTAAYFNQLPLYGVAINLLIVPLVSTVLVPLYALALPLGILPFAGELAGAAASACTSLLLWLVEFLSRLPHASIRVATLPAVASLGFGLAVCILSPRLPGRFPRRAAAAALTVLIALGGAWYARPAPLRYIQLAAGQADCALVLDGETTWMIDAGSDGQDALDYLMDECRDVDALFITHLHMDHIGGVEQLLDSPVRIHQVYLPLNAEGQKIDAAALDILARLEAENIPVSYLARGDELEGNLASLRVLWPDAEGARSGHDANDMLLVLAVNLDGYTLLSASDLTSLYENYAAVPADVLKTAHHGSSASTSDAFLDFVNPQAALLSITSGSSSLPGAATLERLQNHGVRILRTDVCGDITLTVEDGQLVITPYRNEE